MTLQAYAALLAANVAVAVLPWFMAFSRRVTASVLLAVAAGVLGPGSAAVSNAAPAGGAGHPEFYRVPPNGVFALRGHGWGHGHGMSQYGAYGAAKVRGLSYQQILAFYYPGTSIVGQPLAATVRVLLHDTSTIQLAVAPRPDRPVTASLSAPGVPACALPESADGKTTVAQWRVRVTSTADGPRLRLQASTDGQTWSRPQLPDCDPAWSKPIDASVTFAGGAVTDLVRSDGVATYRGMLRAAFTGTHIYVVNVVPLDDYLRSVVPSEMPASWSAAALRAQAVAARTYATYEIAHPKNPAYYDVYDDSRDQVYLGRGHEAASSTAAVMDTEDPKTQTGDVLQDAHGQPAFTQFSSSDGGWTVDGGQPYLPAERDPYDGLVPSSVHSWTASLAATTIDHAYAGQIGRLLSLNVVARDGHGSWGGRITSLVLHGTTGDVTLTGSEFRYAFGLRSEWFRVLLPPRPPAQVTAVVDGGAATVGWQSPTPGGRSAVSGYHVVVHPGGASATVDASARQATVAGLKSGSDYTVSVAALSDSGPGWQRTVTTKVHRVTGAGRVTTAVAASTATFAAGTADGVVLTRRSGDDADGLTAGVLAAAHHAPVLLTARTSLPPATETEIRRVLPAGGTVLVVGSPAAVDDGVLGSLRDLGFKVRRVGGDTPAATARAVARDVSRRETVRSVFEVDARDPMSAWVAAPAAIRAGGVVLLTTGGGQPAETSRWLAHHSGLPRYAVGSAAVAADPSATPLAGKDPVATADTVASRFFRAPHRAVVVAVGRSVPGLVAAERLAVTQGPLLLATGTTLSEATSGYVSGVRSSLHRVDLLGAALPYDDVESGVQAALLGR